MILDLIVILIIVLTAIRGFKRGFVRTVVSIAGWIFSIIIAAKFGEDVKSFFVKYTGLDDWIHDQMYSTLSPDQPIGSNLPDKFQGSANALQNSVVEATANELTSIIMSIFAFLLIILLIKLAIFLIVRLFSKENHTGVLSTVDSVLGLFLGIIKGAILVFLICLIFVPIMNTASTGFSEFFKSSYENSIITPIFYDHNFLINLCKSLM